MRRTIWQTFAAPLLLLGVTLAALILGLVGKGWADVAAIIGLAIPLATVANYLVRRRSAAAAATAEGRLTAPAPTPRTASGSARAGAGPGGR